MSSSDQEFQKNLEFGEFGENIVHQWLIDNFDYVEDNRFQRRDYKFGPKLRGKLAPSNGITLPDFTVFNSDQHTILIDAKTKTRTVNIYGSCYFTVDADKYHDYMRCAEIKNAKDVWFAIVYNNGIFIYASSDFKYLHTFNNRYGTQAYMFELDAKKIVYDF